MSRTTPRLLPLTILLVAQGAVGAAAILARIGMHSGLSPLTLAAWRLLLAASVVLLSSAVRRNKRESLPLTTEERTRLTLAGVCLGLHFLTWFASLERIPVAQSTLLVATSPLWTGIVGLLVLRQRPPVSFWGGLLLAGCGAVGIIVLGKNADFAFSLVGNALALVGAVCFSGYLLLVDAPQRRLGTARTVSWTYTAATITLWSGVLLAEKQAILPQGLPGWLAVIGMALVPQLIGHTAMNWSLLHFPASVVGATTLLEPVFAGLLAWLLFGEPLSGGQMLAAGLLLGGVTIVLWGNRPTTISDVADG